MKYPYIGKAPINVSGKCNHFDLCIFYKPSFGEVLESNIIHGAGYRSSNWCEQGVFENITTEYLANTYGKVVSPEHAEFIIYFAGIHGIANEELWYEGSFFCFIKDVKGDLILSFYEEDVANSDNYKKITIPLPPKESSIEWKEGAVCFAGGSQFKYWHVNRGELITVDNVSILDFETALSFKDFQLNTIKQGDFIEASELDNEQKYNDAVEVFGLFGFPRWESCSFYECKSEILLADSDRDLTGQDDLCDECQRKITFNQLMVIGELKRLELKGGNETLSSDEETELKSRAMASELNSQSNDDEWPKVGDKAAHPVCGLCKVMSLADSNGVVAALNESGFNVLVFKLDLSKPKTPEDLLIEELQTKLVKNNAVDNWMLAANIISGDIEGLTYKSDIESAVKSVINKNLDGDL